MLSNKPVYPKPFRWASQCENWTIQIDLANSDGVAYAVRDAGASAGFSWGAALGAMYLCGGPESGVAILCSVGAGMGVGTLAHWIWSKI